MEPYLFVKYVIIFILSYMYANSIGLWNGYKSIYVASFFVILNGVIDLYVSELHGDSIFDL